MKVSPALKLPTCSYMHAERGSVACEQRSSNGKWLWAEGKRRICMESRFFSQQRSRLLWRKQGLLKGRPRSSQECNMLIADVQGLQFLGMMDACKVGETSLGDRALVGTDAQGTCLCHTPAQGSPSPASHFLARFPSHTGITEMLNSSG